MVEDQIDSKRSAAQEAEEIKQSAASVAANTMEMIRSIEAAVRQTSVSMRNIDELKALETEIQVLTGGSGSNST